MKNNTNARLGAENLKPITIRLAPTQLKALREIAKRDGWRGYNALIRAILDMHLTGQADERLQPW